jgi:type II secretory pathway pseudopilin PulG
MMMAKPFQARRLHSKRGRRRGLVLLAALVCLSIVLAMMGSMLLGALRRSRELRTERDRRQCELLLQAGVDRSAYRWSAELGYRGETWKLDASEITGRGPGSVTIQVQTNTPQGRQVEIVAEYPAGDEFSIRRSRSITLPLKQSPAEE